MTSPGPVCWWKGAEEDQSKLEEEEKRWAAATPPTQTAFASQPKSLEPIHGPNRAGLPPEPQPEPACEPLLEPIRKAELSHVGPPEILPAR